MSDFENKNGMTSEAESVDDILAAILNPDGSFNDEFNGLLKKYVGGDSGDTALPVIDISDRRDEIPSVAARAEYEAPAASVRVEYEAPEEDAFTAPVKDIDERIEEKIPDEIRTVYVQASAEAQRPGFTSTGDVRYPTMGVGAAEERVIYDADWEETAKKEAARLERVRRERMLRGDSAYARSFSSQSAYMPARGYYVDNAYGGSEYIDPISRDADFEGSREGSQYYSSSKKTFFPEGFSVTQKNNTASGGKTERMRSGNTAYMRGSAGVRSDSDWLKVEEKPEKKSRFFSRIKKAQNARPQKNEIREDYEELLDGVRERAAEAAQSEEAVRAAAVVDAKEISQVAKETEGLRSTVAEIVDKYNKRSEEDERRRLEELSRAEDERRERELRERRRLEEIRVIKQGMSPELVEAVESADAEDGFDEYEDFSTEPAPEKPAEEKTEPADKAFGVVFDPSALEDESEIIGQFIEKISAVESGTENSVDVKNADENGTKPIGKGKKAKSSRRKDS